MITAGDLVATPDAAVQTTDQAAGQAPAIVEHVDKVAELVRPWVKSEDYLLVHFDMMEKVKMVFDREGVTIPFSQRDVHFFPASDAR